jgi:hypothetical protein
MGTAMQLVCLLYKNQNGHSFLLLGTLSGADCFLFIMPCENHPSRVATVISGQLKF